MNKTVLVIGIIFLLIGASVVSSTDNIKEEVKEISQSLEPVDNPKVMSACDHIAYIGSNVDDCPLYEISLNDPGTLLDCVCPPMPDRYFFGSIAWAPDDYLYGCEYNSGGLYLIDLEDCSMENIGGGGTTCISLAWDPVNNRLYGSSGSDLYEYDPETGEQEFIGSFGISNAIIGIAINSEGECYAWDVVFSGLSKLFSVDLETGEATEIGSLGLTLLYAQDGDFCKEEDILYLATYTTNPYVGKYLYECDVETGSCTLVGEFHEYAEVYMFTIPFNTPPVTTISFDPPEPDGENGWYVSNVTATLNATDDEGVWITYYRINSGNWKIYDSPFILSEDGSDILIEYYSIDYDEKEENVKSTIIDIDKTSPNMTVEWDVEKLGEGEWEVTFHIEITDGTSGSEGLEIYLNDALQAVLDGPGPFNWRSIILGGVPLSFKFVASDIAGNQAVVVVNDTEISYQNKIKDFFSQQSINPFILRLSERFLIIERFLNTIQGV
jgi:hypothetical protein